MSIAPYLGNSRFIPEAINRINEVVDKSTWSTSSISPTFVLSGGWRSGSTLLQRLVTSDPEVIMWGEPYGNIVPIGRIAEELIRFSCLAERFEQDSMSNCSQATGEAWIANLNPGIAAYVNSLRAQIVSLYGDTATQHGFSKWGIKFVRLSAYHAELLSWLFPKAKFLFLVRNPIDCWNSYSAQGNIWYASHPDFPIDSKKRFFSHWKFIVDSFLDARKDLKYLLVRYEELKSETALGEISQFLEINIQKDVLLKRLGGTENRPIAANRLTRWQCNKICGSSAEKLGYSIYNI